MYYLMYLFSKDMRVRKTDCSNLELVSIAHIIRWLVERKHDIFVRISD
jgi:hypothetical protein